MTGTFRLKNSTRVLIPALLLLALQGCEFEDYTAHRDLVSLDAGEAQANNSAIHTINPWPTYVMDTNLSNDGKRAAAAINRYSDGKGPDSDASSNKAQTVGAALKSLSSQPLASAGPVTKD